MGGIYETNINYPVRFVPDSLSSAQHVVKANVIFNARGSGWELLKRNLVYKFDPLELPLSAVEGREIIPAKEFMSFIMPDLGRLVFNYMVTDSVALVSKKMIQKKIFLTVDPQKLKLKSPYRISGKVYLDPDYITVKGPASQVLKLPDTLNLLEGKAIHKGLDTLLELKKILPSGVKTDYNKAHLIFEVASFAKKKRLIQAVLVDFPDAVVRDLNIPAFKVEYYVQEEHISVENKAKYKIILNYNMRDSVSGNLVPVLVDFPDYIRDYTVSPSVFSLKHVQ